MHECPDCGMACDCDCDDLWSDVPPKDCACLCEDEQADEDVWGWTDDFDREPMMPCGSPGSCTGCEDAPRCKDHFVGPEVD